MVDTNELKRGNKVLYHGDVALVLTISKTSLRVYNLDKNEYIPRWIDDKNFEYLPLDLNHVEELGFVFDTDNNELRHKDLLFLSINEEQGDKWGISFGYFKGWNVTHYHELMNSLWVLGYKDYGNRKKDKVFDK